MAARVRLCDPAAQSPGALVSIPRPEAFCRRSGVAQASDKRRPDCVWAVEVLPPIRREKKSAQPRLVAGKNLQAENKSPPLRPAYAQAPPLSRKRQPAAESGCACEFAALCAANGPGVYANAVC